MEWISRRRSLRRVREMWCISMTRPNSHKAMWIGGTRPIIM
jgi:hypothetical protein